MEIEEYSVAPPVVDGQSRLVSTRQALLRCVAILGAFGLVIWNWRSPIGLRCSSSNLGVLVSCAVLGVAPIVLARSARVLTPILRWLLWIAALPLMLLALLVWLWNVPDLVGKMSRAWEVEPLLQQIPVGSGRIAAYRVETAYSGYMVRLRLEHLVFPGLRVARDIAYVNASQLDSLVLQSPKTLCLSFPAVRPDVAGRGREMQVTFELEPLFIWKPPAGIDDTSEGATATNANCPPPHALH
jgi:hypothetical protein